MNPIPVIPLDARVGTTFRRRFRVVDRLGRDLNVTGWTGRAQVRTRREGTLICELTVTFTAGLLTLSLTPAQTAQIAPGSYDYDVLYTDALGDTQPLMKGTFAVTTGVTQ